MFFSKRTSGKPVTSWVDCTHCSGCQSNLWRWYIYNWIHDATPLLIYLWRLSNIKSYEPWKCPIVRCFHSQPIHLPPVGLKHASLSFVEVFKSLSDWSNLTEETQGLIPALPIHPLLFTLLLGESSLIATVFYSHTNLIFSRSFIEFSRHIWGRP